MTIDGIDYKLNEDILWFTCRKLYKQEEDYFLLLKDKNGNYIKKNIDFVNKFKGFSNSDEQSKFLEENWNFIKQNGEKLEDYERGKNMETK